jgi:hypothetical protein
MLCGVGIAAYLQSQSPREQHVRVVLGNAARDVTGVGLQYATAEGDVAREAHFSYESGQAPRVVAHEPKLRAANIASRSKSTHAMFADRYKGRLRSGAAAPRSTSAAPLTR